MMIRPWSKTLCPRFVRVENFRSVFDINRLSPPNSIKMNKSLKVLPSWKSSAQVEFQFFFSNMAGLDLNLHIELVKENWKIPFPVFELLENPPNWASPGGMQKISPKFKNYSKNCTPYPTVSSLVFPTILNLHWLFRQVFNFF